MEAEHEPAINEYGNKGEARPAYCVLAYMNHLCPPTVKTLTGGAEGGVHIGGGGGTTFNPNEFCSAYPTATLNGLVDPNGTSTRYHFEYWGADGRRSTHPEAVGNSTPPVAVMAQIKLPTSDCYPTHFRIVATSADGTSYGTASEVTFDATA